MKAGPLRSRLLLQVDASGTPDAYGQDSEPWADVATYWGSIRQVSAREAVNADRLKATASHMVTLRHAVGISPATHRLVYADPHTGATRIFNVEIANNVDERNREWELYCIEVKNPQ